MKVLDLINKEKYYVVIRNNLKNKINIRVSNRNEVAKKVNTSRETINRIIDQVYWANVDTLLKLCKLVNISKRSVSDNILKIKTHNSFSYTYRPIINLDIPLARVLGHILGDGGIHLIKREGKYRAFYTNKERKLITSFCVDINKVFKKSKLYIRNRKKIHKVYEVWLCSTVGFILYTLLEYAPSDNKKVPSIIKNSKNKQILAAFIGALYDDEGYLYPQKKIIGFSMADTNLVESIRQIVLKLGIKANPQRIHLSKTRSTMYYFSITGRKNFKRFNSLIKFHHPLKQRKLQLLLEGYTKSKNML